MTYQEFRVAIEKVLPGADFQEDNEGQILIYTGYTEDDFDPPNPPSMV